MKYCFILALALLGLPSYAQITYAPLYDGSTFTAKQIDPTKAVGVTLGSAGVSGTGAATYSIPIWCPPGTNGMTPAISLVYNSQAGNGIMGMGWNISGLSAITRVGKDIYHDGEVAPVDFSIHDNFALDGVRMIVRNGTHGNNGCEYALEAEDFSIITYYKSGSDDYFTVRKKDGTVYQYGKVHPNYTTSPGGPKYYTDDASAVMFWRLNRIMDVNGNYIDFEYRNDFGNRYNVISKIKYTGNDNEALTPYQVIEFEYNGRNDIGKYYQAGSSITTSSLLTKISVKTNNTINRIYELKYGTDNISSYLTEVIEKTTAQSLNSTIFKYGDIPQLCAQQTATNVSLTVTASTNTNLLSGDFNGDGRSDFVAAEYNESTYVHKGKSKIIKYYDNITVFNKSNVNNNYNVVFTETLPQPQYSTVLTDENTANNYGLVKHDCDGDGFDDIIITKSNGVMPTGNFQGVDVYYSQSGTSFNKTSCPAPANYQRHASGGEYIFLGDFDGDAKSDYITILLHTTNQNDSKVFFSSPGNNSLNNVITFNEDPFNDSHTPQMWGFCLAEANDAYVIDFDGDGKNEIMFISGIKTAIYTFNKNSSGQYEATRLLLTNYPTSSHDRLWFGDFNGDGKTDILSKNTNNVWEIAYSDGKKWINSSMNFDFEPTCTYNCGNGISGSKSYVDQIYVADYNGDGKTDIFHYIGYCPCRAYNSKIKIYFSHGYGSLFYSPPAYNWTHIMSPNTMTVTDVNGDGRADMLYREVNGANSTIPPSTTTYPMLQVMSIKPFGRESLLEKVADGLGNITSFEYQSLSSGTRDYRKSSGATYPLNDKQMALYVATKINTPNGVVGSSNNTNYKYEGALVHLSGRGFLGFKKITSETPVSNNKTETFNEINTTYYTPYLKETKTYNTATNQQITYTTNNISFVPGSVSGSFYQQLLSQTEQNLLSGAITITTNTYNNSYGTISSSTTDISGAETITTATTYTQPGTTTIPCMPDEVTVTRTRTGQPAAADKTKFEYDGVGRISGKRERYGNINGLYHTYGYDNYGNLTATAVSNGLSSSAPNTIRYQYAYSADGRFRESSTQVEMNQTSYTTWHPVWGKPLTETDINGIVTTYAYNNWGKLTTAKYKTGTAQEETVTCSDGWDVNGTQCYYTLSSHPAKPDVKTWYDKLGRTLKTRTEHLNGLWTESTAAYDLRGNVTETVAPRLSSETVVKTTTTYDAFNRVSTVTAATGGTTTGSFTYAYTFPGSGRLQTKVTSSSMQESTTLTDAAGKKIESADHGGKLVYTYNSRGDLLTVKHGLITVLTHSYNSIGVKTQTVDVSTGITKYIYDAFGRLKTETDANNKTHTFQYNELGQITQRTGPEGTTTYTYYPTGSGYANQLASVTGFNGVNDYFYYDHLGRLTQKDKDILGDVYTTSYTYDNYDALVRKDYSDGFQLNYSYTNGFLTQVGFPSSHPSNYYFDATGINGQGQYTQYTLANGKQTTNTYTNGYLTSTNTPGVQDLEMDYNYTTGNLLYRKDQVKNLVEDFQYDNLNRLTKSTVTDYNQSVVHPSIDIHYDASGNGTAAISRGNIIAKTDIGNYGYGGTRAASVQNTQTLISEKDQDITYTPFRKTETVTEEDANGNLYDQTFTYDAGYDRVMTILSQGGNQLKIRHYLDDYEVNISPTTGVKTFVHYVAGGDGLCAIVSFNNSFVPVLAYASCKPVYKDHLGSIVAATDFYGAMAAEQNFDAWGRERNPDDWTYNNVTGVGLAQSWLYRGYTGHEHMPHFSIINMNGRMYDPLLGRMMSPDIYLHGGTQGMNRYSYALNNPLSNIDPDGNEPITIGAAIAIGAAISALTYTATAAFSEGGLRQNWNLGSFAYSTAMGGITGALTFGVGNAFGAVGTYGVIGELGRATVHGSLGYITSGGNASSAAVGLVTAGMGSATAGIPVLNTDVGGTLFSAGIGALSAEMTGGEWWMGAGQAVAVHLLNQVAHEIDGDGDGKGKGEGKGNKLRGGNQKQRDGDLGKYPQAFKDWYHKNKGSYVLPGQPDPNLDDIYEEWIALGRPNFVSTKYKFNYKDLQQAYDNSVLPSIGPANGIIKMYRNVIIGIDAASQYILPSQSMYVVPPVFIPLLVP